MSLSVSGVTPVFFTRSSQEEKLKRPSSTNWLLVSPMLEKIPTPTESEVSLLRSLMSCGPIPLAKVRPPAALVPPFFGGIGDRLCFKEPEGRNWATSLFAPLAPGALSPGGQLR